MPITRRYACGDVEIVVWAIEETSEQLSALLGDAVLSQQTSSFGSEARRAEWLAVRLLLREILGCSACIDYAADGKPFLVGESGCISISHTRGFAALAFSRARPMGLDIELVTRKVGIARSFVIKESEYCTIPLEQRDAYMLLRWTACEALYKLAGGCGYRERLSMPVFAPARAGTFCVSLQGDAHSAFSVGYNFDDGLLLALCFEGENAALPLRV